MVGAEGEYDGWVGFDVVDVADVVVVYVVVAACKKVVGVVEEEMLVELLVEDQPVGCMAADTQPWVDTDCSQAGLAVAEGPLEEAEGGNVAAVAVAAAVADAANCFAGSHSHSSRTARSAQQEAWGVVLHSIEGCRHLMPAGYEALVLVVLPLPLPSRPCNLAEPAEEAGDLAAEEVVGECRKAEEQMDFCSLWQLPDFYGAVRTER